MSDHNSGTLNRFASNFEWGPFRTTGMVLPKDFANYKDEALEIYPTIVYACTTVQLYFDVIGYFGCLRVKRSTLKP